MACLTVLLAKDIISLKLFVLVWWSYMLTDLFWTNSCYVSLCLHLIILNVNVSKSRPFNSVIKDLFQNFL